MKKLGEGHFVKPLEPLAGEKVLWEGRCSKHALSVFTLRILMGLAIFVLVYLGIHLYVVHAVNSYQPEKERPSISKAVEEPKDESIEMNGEVSKADVEKIVARDSFYAAVPIMVFLVLGTLGIFSVGVMLRIRNSWYVITTERICIQSGALAKTISILDLDKIVSVRSTSGWLDRRFGLHSIELVHAGVNFLSQGGAFRFMNPTAMTFIPCSSDVLSKLTNEWLPRDNHARA